MKDFVGKSALFSLFFLLVFFAINLIFFVLVLVTDWDWKKRVEALQFKNPSYELLVLGSSLPEYGIDTGFLTENGISYYNMAILGNNVKTSYVQLYEYIIAYPKKPKYVLLALNSELESTDGLTIHPMVEYTMQGYQYSIDDFPLFKFSKWFGGEILKKIFSRNHRDAKVVLGQIKRDKSTPDISDFQEIYLDVDEFESSYWMGEIAKLCRHHHIEFLIIEIPSVKETQNLSEFGPYTLKFNNGFDAELYNFNSQEFCELFDPKNDWVGDSHLNPYGAIKFTKELIKVLD